MNDILQTTSWVIIPLILWGAWVNLQNTIKQDRIEKEGYQIGVDPCAYSVARYMQGRKK